MLCFYSLSAHYQFIANQILLNRSTNFSEKIGFFRVGKKAKANRKVLLQFLVASWLVRIAIVLGCVG